MEKQEQRTEKEKNQQEILHYSQILQREPDNLDALIKLSKTCYSKGNYHLAIQHAHKILELKPTNIEALQILASSYYYINEDEKAIEYCNRWTESDFQHPTIPQALALLNQIYTRKAEESTQFKRKLEQMIQQYTHTLANTLFPNMIYEVANKLKNHDELKKDALFLLRAYQAEMFISKQGELLEIKHTGDAKDFRSYIRRSCLNANTEKDFTTVEQILDAVAARVIARFLNQSKLEHIRNLLSNKRGVSVDTWRTSFDEEVLMTAQKSAIAWASEYIAQISYTVSSVWQALKFRTGAESYAEALLWGHFGELLFNALKYTDYSQNEWVTIRFDEEDGYLTTLWENPYSPAEVRPGWRSKGIESIRNDLEMLNQVENPSKSLEVHSTDHKFSVKLYLAKSVFFYQSMITRTQKSV